MSYRVLPAVLVLALCGSKTAALGHQGGKEEPVAPSEGPPLAGAVPRRQAVRGERAEAAQAGLSRCCCCRREAGGAAGRRDVRRARPSPHSPVS